MTARRALLMLVCAAWMVSTGGFALYSVLRSEDPLGYKAVQLPVVSISLALGFALARVGRLARSEAGRPPPSGKPPSGKPPSGNDRRGGAASGSPRTTRGASRRRSR